MPILEQTDELPKVRYDDLIKFTNPTAQDFVGRWDGEAYLIESGEVQLFPAWLARHFSKRLCDIEMNRQHGEPLKIDDPERMAFIAKCIGEEAATAQIETSAPGKLTTKQQIETDHANRARLAEERQAKRMSRAEKKQMLVQQLAALEAQEEEEKASKGRTTPRHAKAKKTAKEMKLAKELAAEAKKVSKEGISQKNPVGAGQDDEMDAPVFEGSTANADRALRKQITGE